MQSIKEQIAKLAFKVDKAILKMEEEDFLRMDIPASEKLNLSFLNFKRPTRLGNVRQFVTTAAIIFAVLFGASNAGSYSKIIKASIQDIPSAPDLIEIPDEFLSQKDGLLPLQAAPVSSQNRISIPAIDVSSRIVEVEGGIDSLIGQDWTRLEEDMRSALREGVVHYPGTALPGQDGNTFFTGHSSNVFWEKSAYNDVFALLPKIEVGDKIYITYDQEEFIYEITSKEEVKPNNVSVLEQTETPTISLLSCVPVGTRINRLHVVGKLVSE